MPAKKKRNYRAEYDSYHSKPKQKANRAKRNAARKTMEKEGKVRKGDNRDVDHKKKLSNGGSNAKSNLRVKSKSANRADNGKKGGRPRKKK